MAIARPVTRTVISTTAFGIPVADGVNALTPMLTYGRVLMVGELAVPSNATVMTLQVSGFLGNGMGSSSTGFVIQQAGLYYVSAQLLFRSTGAQAGASAYLEARCMVGSTLAGSTFMGPTGTYYALPLAGFIRCAVGDAVSITVASNFTNTVTDNRGQITMQWIGA